jgi:hypothetical protein
MPPPRPSNPLGQGGCPTRWVRAPLLVGLISYLKTLFISSLVLEPYAMKVARTVLRGGKREISYLSQQTL